MRACVVAFVLVTSAALLMAVFLFRRVCIEAQTTDTRVITTSQRQQPLLRGTGRFDYESLDSGFNHFGSLLGSSAGARERRRNATIPEFVPLTRAQVDGVERFVLFIGYPGSGHSIIGSVMDAHPQMIVSHEFSVLLKISRDPKLSEKVELFNALCKRSYEDYVKGWRNGGNKEKGYNLGIGNRWQGTFEDLKVIGDKSGGRTTRYYRQYPADFDRSYRQLLKTVGVPVRVIHVVRNPYDMAATDMLYRLSHKLHGVKYTGVNATHKYNDTAKLHRYILGISSRAEINTKLIQKYHMNVLEIHNAEFVMDPRATVRRICEFLSLHCPESYLQECSLKAFKEVSRTRNLVVWNKELVQEMNVLIKRYPFFQRYSFDSN